MDKVGRSKHADLSISETFQNIGQIVYHMQTPTFWAYRSVSVPRLSRRFSFSLSSWIGCLSHGVKETPVPLTELTVVHSSAPGPPGHPHQFSVASTVAPLSGLMLSTPMFPPSKLLRCTATRVGVFLAFT